jgi:hypothetical protein
VSAQLRSRFAPVPPPEPPMTPFANLARAVLANALHDATVFIPDWSNSDKSRRLREARAEALAFLLSDDEGWTRARKYWWEAAGIAEPSRERVLEALRRKEESCRNATR